MGGNKLLRSISDTLVEREAVGTENFLGAGAGAAAGGKEGALFLSSVGAVFRMDGSATGIAHVGTSM